VKRTFSQEEESDYQSSDSDQALLESQEESNHIDCAEGACVILMNK